MRKQILIIFAFLIIPLVSLSLLEQDNCLLLNDSDINSEILELNGKLKSSSTISLNYAAQDYIGLTEDLWENNLTGKDITIAILDTGIYPNHSVFTDNGLNNWNKRIIAFYDETIDNVSDTPYDIQWHGTWAASILGGNSSEYTGVAPEVKFIILRLFYKEGYEIVTTLPILENGINWILDYNRENQNNTIKVVSMSFGVKPTSTNLPYINAMNQIVDKLSKEGILVVAAAGNDGESTNHGGFGTINAPASAKSVLAVGGVDYDGEMYSLSSKGPTHNGIIKPDVCAPAVNVYGAYPSAPPLDYLYASGTSASTPFVAGLAALMLEKNQNLTPQQLKNIISLTSFKTINPRIVKDNVQGWGIVQGYAIMDALRTPFLFTQNTEISISLNENETVYCLPITLQPNHYFFELEQLNSTKAEMFIFDFYPDNYGNPILISDSINDFPSEKRMGVFTTRTHEYFLVVKLLERYSGNFIIKLVLEYRIGIIIALSAINFIALVYAIKIIFNFKKENKRN
ncbi:MAG: S8 family serine peptidase [Candidatus Hodarchaeota archaeon]